MYVCKDVLNYYLVCSSTYNSLKSAKNVFFFLFCILVDMQMEGAIAPSPGYATEHGMEYDRNFWYGIEYGMEDF